MSKPKQFIRKAISLINICSLLLIVLSIWGSVAVGEMREESRDMKIQQTVNNNIHSAKVVIFAKSYCPYCVRVKNLFEKINVPFTAYDMDVLSIV